MTKAVVKTAAALLAAVAAVVLGLDGAELLTVPDVVVLGCIVTSAVLAPVVLAGGVVGIFAVRRIGQRSFDAAVLVASLISALALLIA